MVMLRNVTGEDAALLFDWANDTETRSMSISTAEINWENHVTWFEKKLVDENTKMFILEENGNAVGQIRLENKGEGWVIGYSIAAAYRGHGFGKKIIELAIDKIKSGIFIAFVKPENIASVKIFSRLGFSEVGTEEQNNSTLIKFIKEKQS